MRAGDETFFRHDLHKLRDDYCPLSRVACVYIYTLAVVVRIELDVYFRRSLKRWLYARCRGRGCGVHYRNDETSDLEADD